MSTIELTNKLQKLIYDLNTHVTTNQPLKTLVLQSVADHLEQWLDSYESWSNSRRQINLVEEEDEDMEYDEEDDQEEESEEGEEDEEEYTVSRLLAFDGKDSYLVEWEGYDSSANSWEPSRNISPDCIKEFWRKRYQNH
jgi:hypothetical protein